MPSLSSALEKLHIRRKSTSSSSNTSPHASPTRQNNGSGRSFEGSRGSPGGLRVTMATAASSHAVTNAPKSSSDASATPPGLNSSVPEVSAATPGQPAPEVPAKSAGQVLPRSQAQYALPTVPQTPLDYNGSEEGMLAGKAHSTSTVPPRLPAIERLSGLDVGNLGSPDNDIPRDDARSVTHWTMAKVDQPFEARHALTLPISLFPATVLPFPFDHTSAKMAYDLPQGFQAMQQVQRADISTSKTASARLAPVDLAFVADHYDSVGFPRGRSSTSNEEEHFAHLQKHLSLLSPRIFMASKLGHDSKTSSKATKVVSLKASPVVPYQQAEAELSRQRDSLINSIVNGDQYRRGDASAALMNAKGIGGSKLELDPRKKIVFDSIGWTERLGILDTVDVHTTYLEPVIQEHVQPIEHNIYTTLIYREIHRYHIYPYIQPIADPKPKVLPTRHLFLDESIAPTADGRKAYRVIYGDEAAEEVLGRTLTAEDRRQTSYERWIEGVDGVEYQKMEAEAVEVGKRGWVERVGQRMDGEAVEWYAKLADDGRDGQDATRASGVNTQSYTAPRQAIGSSEDNGAERAANGNALNTEQATGKDIVHGIAI